MLKFSRKSTGPSPEDSRVQARVTFEQELKKRGVGFSMEDGTGRYKLQVAKFSVLVSIDNLLKEVERDHDLTRVARFVDTVLSTPDTSGTNLSRDRLFWCLEPSDHVEKADIRVPVSDRVDRVLTLFSVDQTKLTWVSATMLERAKVSLSEATASGFENLARELAAAKIEFSEIDDVRLGIVNTELPFKSSLILAPNLRTCVENILGWPLQGVAPDRNFLYLWAARHDKFVGRVGRVVVEEYSKAAYPLSTEVYSLSDDGVRAIGEFPSGK